MPATGPDETRFLSHDAPQWRLIWQRFKKSRAAVIGGLTVLLFYFMAIFADFIAPNDPALRSIGYVAAPPMTIRFLDDNGLSRPFVYGLHQEKNMVTFERYYVVDEGSRHALHLFVRGDRYRLWGLIESDLHLVGIEGEARIYLFGTDEQGRDLLSRTIFGARLSLTIGLIGITISFLLGVTLGALSGYVGGLLDIVLQRLIEIITSVPTLPLWMGLSAAIPEDWPIERVFFAIVIILSFLSWPQVAREVRGRFLALREETFVTAAALDGVGSVGIMFRHMIPSFMSHIIATATLAIPGMIIGETALSFLGLGLHPPAISWGVLLFAAQSIKTLISLPWLLLPGVFVVVSVLAFNFFGDGLRDAADPYK